MGTPHRDYPCIWGCSSVVCALADISKVPLETASHSYQNGFNISIYIANHSEISFVFSHLDFFSYYSLFAFIEI